MAVFEYDLMEDVWRPTPVAAGPFAGLHGGAVAGLLTAGVEAAAIERGWGAAVNASAWFLKPTPPGPLRTQISVLREGRRATIVDNTLYLDGETEPRATARVLLLKERSIDLPEPSDAPRPVGPESCKPVQRVAPHGGPWFMDAMEARRGADISWFRLHTSVVEGAGPLSRVLGPADWAHGINRPREDVVADPNPNITVHLSRPPRGEWIGVRSTTSWVSEAGSGHGHGSLWDVDGEIGSVAMAVALTPLLKGTVLKGAA